MADEFVEFVALLARLARFIIDTTVNVVHAFIAIAALMLPWRLVAVAIGMRKHGTDDLFTKQAYFRFWAWQQLGCSLFDAFTLLLTLATIVWPLRWPMFVKHTRQAVTTSRDLHYSLERRCVWNECNLEAMADLLVLPLGIVALLAPWRVGTFCRRLSTSTARGDLELDNRITIVRGLAFAEGLEALLDAPLFTWALPLSVVVPSRWCSMVALSFTPRLSDSWRVRWFWLQSPAYAALDVFACVLGVVPFIVPWRARAFVKRMLEIWHSREVHTSTSRFGILMWHHQLRLCCVRFGMVALIDVLLLPVLLVLFAFIYRAGPLLPMIHRKRRCGHAEDALGDPLLTQCCYHLDSDRTVTPTNIELPTRFQRMALRQFGLVCLDVLTFPFLLLLVTTVYRIPSFRESARRDLALAHHRAIVWNAFVVLHDGLQLLVLLVLVLTIYRAQRTCRMFAQRASDFRKEIWCEFFQLLRDLPLLPFLLLLLVTLWRSDLVIRELWEEQSNNLRRYIVLSQTLRLVRDMLGFLLAAILMLSLLRLPPFLLDLWAQRSRSVRGEPRFRLTRATLLLPDLTSTDRRPTMTLYGDQPEARLREQVGTLRMDVISISFWDEIARAFGCTLASIGRGLMPYTLTDGKQISLDAILPRVVEVEFRLGGREMRARLMKLDHNVNICVQLQHHTPDHQEEVLMRFVLPVALMQQAADHPGVALDLPAEFLDPAAAERKCGPLVEGVGIRDGLWLCAFLQFSKLLQDIFHLMLFICTLIAPWRVVACLYFIRAHESNWARYVARRAIRLASLRDVALRRYRENLEPVLNMAAKRQSLDSKLVASSALRTVALRQLSEYALPPDSLQRRLLRELQQQGPAAADIAEGLRVHSALQDAVGAYWPGLTFAINTHACAGQVDPHDHAHCLIKIASSGHHAEGLLRTSLAELQRSEENLPFERTYGLCGCIFSKSRESHGKLVRTFFVRAITDWILIFLLLFLVATIYRLPSLCKDTRRSGSASSSDTFRVSISHQVFLLARDMWQLLSAAVASCLALVTLVKALDFLEDLLLHCNSACEVRAAGFRRTKEALADVWELVTLLFLWKTYKFLVRAFVFSLLLPSYGLRGLPLRMRIVLWMVICTLPWVLPVPSLALAVTVSVVFASLCVTLWRSEESSCLVSGRELVVWHSIVMRFTWMNVLAIMGLLVETMTLALAPRSGAALSNKVSLLLAVTASILWVTVLALPIAMDDRNREICLGNLKYHAFVKLARRCYIILVVAVLCTASGDSSWTSRGAVFVLSFVVTISVLGLAQQRVDDLSVQLGLDLAHSPMYSSGLTFAQFTLLATELFAAHPIAQVLIAAVPLMWVVAYPWRFGTIGGPPWLWPLHIGAAQIPFYTRVCDVVSINLDPTLGTDIATYAVLFGMGVSLMTTAAHLCYAARIARTARTEASMRSSIRDAFLALGRKGAFLCCSGEAQAATIAVSRVCNSVSWLSAAEFACVLQAFEEQVRIERLDLRFLKSREMWLEELRAGRHSYEIVAGAALKLVEAIRTPPSRVLILSALRISSPTAKKLSPPLWSMIMDYVCKTQKLDAFLQSFLHQFAAGSPAHQLDRACASLAWCVDMRSRLRYWEMCEPGSSRFVTEDNAMVGLPVEQRQDGADAVTYAHGQIVSKKGSQCLCVQWSTAKITAISLPNSSPLKVASDYDISHIVQASIDAWKADSPYVLFGRCDCGRAKKPKDRHYKWPCEKRQTYDFCCRNCALGKTHTAECDRRQGGGAHQRYVWSVANGTSSLSVAL